MTSTQLLELLRLLLREPLALFWAAVAWGLDRARHLDSLSAGLVAVLLLSLSALLAWGLQRRWTERIDEGSRSQPPRRLGLGAAMRLEITHSPLFLPLKPFQLLGRGLAALGRGLRRLVHRVRHRRSSESGPERPPEPPLLAPSLGPSFLVAGVAAVALDLLGRGVAPLIAAELGLSPGLSPWQYLAFGGRPELAWILPLERYPYLAGLLALGFWSVIWWLAGAAFRWIRLASLGANLLERRRDPSVLPWWRRWAGAPELWRPAASYRRWAVWAPGLMAPLLAWAWLHLGGHPYRSSASELAVVALLWLSWLLHLVLTGTLREAPKPTAEESPEGPTGHGWCDVLAHLETERQVAPPEPFPVTAAAEPAPAPATTTVELLSPLVFELLERSTGALRDPRSASPPRLTRMQHDVLTTLALQGYVHTDPPVTLERLKLGPAEGEALEDVSGLRSRNQVVLAPEGWGKTTLGMLAVANHSLVHTRGSLVIAATPRQAAALHDRYREAVEPSTLRWNVRIRTPGPDLMNDLSRGIVPDVVVTDLHDLVVTLLDRTTTFAPFLRNLGLIVLDDVESFFGPAEVHAQLAMRRLILRVEELTGVHELGGPELAAPQVLILGTDGMDETSEWAQSLCGVEAVTRRFGGAEDRAEGEPEAVHWVYRLRDFTQPGGEPLEPADLVAACEALEVSWCYRPCGDGRRNLARGPLLLPDEPRHATDHPAEACVLLLDGTWSEVRRERLRLSRAGIRFARRRGAGPGEPIALVTRVEPDLEMAFTQLDERFALTPILESLPRPVLRPPTGLAVLPHLSADLTQHWTEVADVVRIFGAPVAEVLRDLTREGLLLAEERRDVATKAAEFVRRVHVQALARAVRAQDEGSVHRGLEGALPPKVSQVELVSPRSVAVRDRTNLTMLAEIDAASAHLVYYPGRIFREARGTFVVVEHLSEGAEGALRPGDVLVEPLLSDSWSTPRRRPYVEVMDEAELGDEGDQIRQAAGGELFGPDTVLVGRFPVALGLHPVRIVVEHLATYRLGPTHREIRQRSVIPRKTREHLLQRPLETVALAIHPNPAADSPALTLDAARLLAAVMRAVLPNMMRGAGESVGVALKVTAADGDPDGDQPLGSDDAFYLFDADAGGNGTARAIYRDGVDVLLRLCRLVVERVLSLDRLRALHDEWSSLEEILAEGRRELGGEQDVVVVASERRERDHDLRQRLLEWLDSRLVPEGGTEARREIDRLFASGYEEGEGDVIDLGRCWTSLDGAVTDLLWAKHRWHRAGGGEALLDVGFDRSLLTGGRTLVSGADGRLAAYGRLLDERRSRDGKEGLGPAPVILSEGSGAPPDNDAEKLYRRLWSMAGDAREALTPLAERLRSAWEQQPPWLEGSQPSLQEALWRFVQGIPPSRPAGENGGFTTPASPVEVLLRRHGTGLEKALVLALLHERCGLAAGCFVSLAERRAAGAVAAPAVGTDGPAEGGPEPPFWAEPTAGGERVLPVALDRRLEIGRIEAANPSSWLFLPLNQLPPRLAPNGRGPGSSGKKGGSDDA